MCEVSCFRSSGRAPEGHLALGRAVWGPLFEGFAEGPPYSQAQSPRTAQQEVGVAGRQDGKTLLIRVGHERRQRYRRAVGSARPLELLSNASLMLEAASSRDRAFPRA